MKLKIYIAGKQIAIDAQEAGDFIADLNAIISNRGGVIINYEKEEPFKPFKLKMGVDGD